MSIFDIPAITKDMASKRNKWSVVKLKQENEKLKEELATLKRRLEAAEAVCESCSWDRDDDEDARQVFDEAALEAWRKEQDK